MTPSQLRALPLGTPVTTTGHLLRIWSGNKVTWTAISSKHQSGTYIGYRHLKKGIRTPGTHGWEGDPPEFQVTGTVLAALVVFTPRTNPAPIPITHITPTDPPIIP